MSWGTGGETRAGTADRDRFAGPCCHTRPVDARILLVEDDTSIREVTALGLRAAGLEVCRAIRRESTPPVVMLTARADTIDVVVGLESGADDYVRKKFIMGELGARTVDRDGTDIPLTRTEFDLLTELARRPGAGI